MGMLESSKTIHFQLSYPITLFRAPCSQFTQKASLHHQQILFIASCALFLFPLDVHTMRMQMTNILYCAARHMRRVSSAYRSLSFQFLRITITKTDSWIVPLILCFNGLFIAFAELKGKTDGAEVSRFVIDMWSRYLSLNKAASKWIRMLAMYKLYKVFPNCWTCEKVIVCAHLIYFILFYSMLKKVILVQ